MRFGFFFMDQFDEKETTDFCKFNRPNFYKVIKVFLFLKWSIAADFSFSYPVKKKPIRRMDGLDIILRIQFFGNVRKDRFHLPAVQSSNNVDTYNLGLLRLCK